MPITFHLNSIKVFTVRVECRKIWIGAITIGASGTNGQWKGIPNNGNESISPW